MSSSKKIIIIIISAIILAVIVFYAITFYRQIKEPVAAPVKAIPLDASIILEIKNAVEVWGKVSSGNDMWNDIKTIYEVNLFNKQIQKLDSIISTDRRISKLLNEQTSYITIHTSELFESNILFILGSADTRESNYLKKFILDLIPEKKPEKYKNTDIFKIPLNVNDDTIYFYVHKGLFACSPDIKLLERSIEQLDSKTIITDDDNLMKVKRTSGKKVDANIYINYKNIRTTIQSLCKKETQKYVEYFNELAEWTEIDLLIKNDKLLFNGFTSVSENSYLKLFDEQPPQTISIINYIPLNTIYFLNFGFGNFSEYYKSYKSFLQNSDMPDTDKVSIDEINTKYNIDAEKYFIPWIGNEIALVITDQTKSSTSQNLYLILNSKNIDAAKNEMRKLSEIINEYNQAEPFIGKYNEYEIGKIDIPGIIPGLFGEQYEALESNYYTIFDNYVIFANNTTSLHRYLNALKMDKSLMKNENYLEFYENVTEKANVYMYLNIRKSLDLIRKNSIAEVSRLMDNYTSLFMNFEAFSVQFSSNSTLFYTNICLKHNPSFEEENASLREVNLESEVIGQPFLIRDHTDNSKKIIAFDDNNQMYMFDQDGDLLWKIKLAENIISDLFEVDFYKNGKIQYLFNTDNYLYLIDLHGNNVEDYPKKLPAQATNGISLFDYNKTKDYRILIACDNNRIYNLDIRGQSVSGWKMNKTQGKVSQKLTYLKSAGKDYIITPEDDGKITITDRRGSDKFTAGKNAMNSTRSDIFLNETNSRGLFLTTNLKGELIYLYPGKDVKKTLFGQFSEDHFFLYEDFDMDGNKDFIFLDKNKLIIYDRFKKIILNHTFDNIISIKPEIFSLDKTNVILGVIDSKKEEVYLFNKDGIIDNGESFSGRSGFVLEKDKASGNLLLITSSGNTLYKYEILN